MDPKSKDYYLAITYLLIQFVIRWSIQELDTFLI